MSLTISEAIAAQALIRWVSTLKMWERVVETEEDVQAMDEALVTHARILGRAAFARLGAGPSEAESEALIREGLGLP
jgi:hypothetical protein